MSAFKKTAVLLFSFLSESHSKELLVILPQKCIKSCLTPYKAPSCPLNPNRWMVLLGVLLLLLYRLIGDVSAVCCRNSVDNSHEVLVSIVVVSMAGEPTPFVCAKDQFMRISFYWSSNRLFGADENAYKVTMMYHMSERIVEKLAFLKSGPPAMILYILF